MGVVRPKLVDLGVDDDHRRSLMHTISDKRFKICISCRKKSAQRCPQQLRPRIQAYPLAALNSLPMIRFSSMISPSKPARERSIVQTAVNDQGWTFAAKIRTTSVLFLLSWSMDSEVEVRRGRYIPSFQADIRLRWRTSILSPE